MILFDTTPLVALCDSADSLNAAAWDDLVRFDREQFAVCLPVITEACFHLRDQRERQRLRQLLEDVQAVPLALSHEDSRWSDVFDWMAKYADHRPDWADAYLAVLSGLDRRLKVWTYDREFRTTWRRPDGTVIPLAVP